MGFIFMDHFQNTDMKEAAKRKMRLPLLVES
jgi:hypothetical protein